MSVRLKLTAFNLFLVLLAGLMIAGILLKNQQESMLHEKSQRAAEILKNLVTSHKEDVILGEEFNLKTAADRFLAGNSDVLVLVIDYNDNQSRIAVAREPEKQERLTKLVDEFQNKLQFEFEGQDVLVFQQAVDVKGKVFGKITLGMSLAALQQQIAEQSKTAGLTALVIVLVFMLIASLVNGRVISPIEVISGFAKELGEGQLGRTIEIGRKDEFGHLAEVMSYMSKQLLSAQNDLVASERLAQELDIARNIQMKFLPDEELDVKNLSYKVYFRSAKEVGGDVYDYVKLADGRFGFIVADVSGKGIEGALGMITCSALFRSAVLRGVTDPLKILDDVNEGLHDRLPGTMFVTAVLIVFDQNTRELSLVSAGHPEAFRFGNGKYEDITGDDTGVPLGIAESALWRTRTVEKKIKLAPGEGVIIYTDGITETFNEQKSEIFGDERVAAFVKEHANLNAESMIARLVDTLNKFRGNRDDQDDDMTILAIKTV